MIPRVHTHPNKFRRKTAKKKGYIWRENFKLVHVHGSDYKISCHSFSHLISWPFLHLDQFQKIFFLSITVSPKGDEILPFQLTFFSPKGGRIFPLIQIILIFSPNWLQFSNCSQFVFSSIVTLLHSTSPLLPNSKVQLSVFQNKGVEPSKKSDSTDRPHLAISAGWMRETKNSPLVVIVHDGRECCE
jgi:hypothetical protein